MAENNSNQGDYRGGGVIAAFVFRKPKGGEERRSEKASPRITTQELSQRGAQGKKESFFRCRPAREKGLHKTKKEKGEKKEHSPCPIHLPRDNCIEDREAEKTGGDFGKRCSRRMFPEYVGWMSKKQALEKGGSIVNLLAACFRESVKKEVPSDSFRRGCTLKNPKNRGKVYREEERVRTPVRSLGCSRNSPPGDTQEMSESP